MTFNHKDNTTNEYLVREVCKIDVSVIFVPIMVKMLSDINFSGLINKIRNTLYIIYTGGIINLA